jgi:hypothetical protein
MNTKYIADIIQSGVHCMAVSFIPDSIEILMYDIPCTELSVIVYVAWS